MRTGIIREIIIMSLDSLKKNKLRSFLTLIGIMIGIMTVIGMVSVIQGLNRTFLSHLESMGTDMISVMKNDRGIMGGDLSDEERRRKDLTFEDARAIEKECSLIKAVAVALPATIFAPIPVKFRNTKSENAVILGLNENWSAVFKAYSPRKGRFFTEFDILHRAKVCVLGSEVNEVLFPHANAVGKEIRIGRGRYTVIGVLEKRGQVFGQSQDNIVGLPVTTLMKNFPHDLENIQIIAASAKPGTIQEAIEQIVNVLRRRRNVPFGKPNDFVVYSQDTLINFYNQITEAVFLVLIAISSIALLVGGIGVMNIMLVTVKERTREIGIRKALGARSGDIMKQFLIEAVIMTAVGGVLGILSGLTVAFFIKTLTPLPASVTPWSVLLGLGISVSVGLFFGIFPARRAAGMDPIISLRYE